MADQESSSYQVFARKYRPATFASLVGQESLVRIMSNAFAEDRIAHAFILTGVRGVGKTTTARIIAKGLNCMGPDGQGEPTVEPCGQCSNCREIDAGRHVDVLEMDAASRTGVNDIRDIIDGVPFQPVAARYKIYIIDEVHMLSTNAFNALLKTLEEPPQHVKFIFATTEIRMVPVTVLSRCQRFDLRRVEPEVMSAHLTGIATREGAEIAEDALALIVRASEGSVRDALSLLDQSIALGSGRIAAEEVRNMLGIADKGRTLDLFELIMRGKTPEALDELASQFKFGIEPEAVLKDLAETIHWISVLKVSPGSADDPGVGPEERKRGTELAAGLPMRSLARAWQMAVKSIGELGSAPNSRSAVEMAVIRLSYVAELPTPEELVKQLAGASERPGPAREEPPSPASMPAPPEQEYGLSKSAPLPEARSVSPQSSPEAGIPSLSSLDELIAMATGNQTLADTIRKYAVLKWLDDVEQVVLIASEAPSGLTEAVRDLLDTNGFRGLFIVEDYDTEQLEAAPEPGESAAEEIERLVRDNPLTQSVLSAFPGSKILVQPAA